MRAPSLHDSEVTIDGTIATRTLVAGLLVVGPKGPSLREADAAGLLEEVLADLPKVQGRVLMDMARVEFMSSAGISMLVQLAEACRRAGGSLAVCGLAKPIAQVLRTTRVDRLFAVHKDRDKALARLAGGR
ncbi:MAG: hypothetical protein KatS3mg103_0319 [Phycisphaerales bacterium]|nr:MAG: hypothetical protein KatS3mg103_0319 [Phycisphaerales bacterium]